MCKIILTLRNRKDPISIRYKKGTLFFSKKGINFVKEDGDFISLSISCKDILNIEIVEE